MKLHKSSGVIQPVRANRLRKLLKMPLYQNIGITFTFVAFSQNQAAEIYELVCQLSKGW